MILRDMFVTAIAIRVIFALYPLKTKHLIQLIKYRRVCKAKNKMHERLIQ